MIVKRLDISSLSQLLSREEIDNLAHYVVRETTAYVYEQWYTVAKNGLRAARRIYLDSLQIKEEGDTGIILLTRWLPLAIEEGHPPFDMKPGFAGSSSTKVNKKGEWYLNIPRRFAAAGSLGESDVFFKRLPPEIYKELKELPVRKAIGARGGHTVRQEVRLGSKTFPAYKSRSEQFEGIQRIPRRGGGSQYVSFRTAGQKSDPNAWIHPGIKARHFADKALDDGEFEEAVDTFIEEFIEAKVG